MSHFQARAFKKDLYPLLLFFPIGQLDERTPRHWAMAEPQDGTFGVPKSPHGMKILTCQEHLFWKVV